MSTLHIHDGGTGITNFDAEQQPLYERAIAAFGDPSLYVGVPMRFSPGGRLLCLHSSSGRFPEDMKRFWTIFDELRAIAKETP